MLARLNIKGSQPIQNTMAVVPLGWLFLSFFPLLVLAILNYPVFDSRDLLIVSVWCVVLYWVYYITQRSWVYLLAFSLIFIEGFLNLTHILLIHAPLSANSLFVLANTNTQEANDFLQLKQSSAFLFGIPFLALGVWAFRFNFSIKKNGSSNKPLIFLMLACGIFLFENLWHQRFVRKATPPATRAIVSFVETQQHFLQQKPRERQMVPNTFSTNENDVVVLIVGESLTRRHMQLYGYNRPTNPLLRQRNDILVYNRAVSPYTHTLTALLSAFTTSNIDNQQAYDSALSIIDVYASAGYKTYWLSNQSPAGLWDNAIYRLAQTAHQSVFINRLGNSSFDATLQASYDEALLPELSKALNDSANKKLIVLHLMGNHSLYEKRYPASFTYFPLDKDKKQTTINAYDNAVRYNDYVMNCLFDTMTQRAQQHPHISYAACYWSDHGENVYDENNAVGHDYTGLVPWTQIEVPFMIWCSAKHPLNERLQHGVWAQQKNNVFMTDDLFHTFLDAAGIRTAAFDSTRSIFNTHFNSSRPARLEDGNVYR